MAGPPISAASGSQNATLATNHTLATITTPGTYVLTVDTSALANGETLTLTIKTKCRTGDASVQAFSTVYKHAQGNPAKVSVPVPVIAEGVFILRQDGGTGRAYPWNILDLVHAV